MIEQLAEETITEYAPDTQTIQEPYGSDYYQGVHVGRTIPAKWWNWLFNAITKRMSQAKSDLAKMLLELQNVILHTGSTLDSTDSTQLATAVQAISTDSISDYRQQYDGFLGHWEELCPDFTDSDITAYFEFATLLTPDVAYGITNHSSSLIGETMVFSERLHDGTWRWHKLPTSASASIDGAYFVQGNIFLHDSSSFSVLLGFKNYFQVTYNYFYMGTRAYSLLQYNSSYDYLYALNDQGGIVKIGELYRAGMRISIGRAAAAIDFGDYYVIGNLKYTKATMQLEIISGDIDATIVVTKMHRLASGNYFYFYSSSDGLYRIKIFNGQSIINGLGTYSTYCVAQTGAVFISTRQSEGGVYHYTYSISFDGLTSTLIEGLPSGAYLYTVFYNDGHYYVRNGYTSTDGIHWSYLDSKPGRYLLDMGIDGVLLSITNQYVTYISFDGGATWEVTDMDSSLGQYIYSNINNASVLFRFDSSQMMSIIYNHNDKLKRVKSLRINNKVLGRTLYLS